MSGLSSSPAARIGVACVLAAGIGIAASVRMEGGRRPSSQASSLQVSDSSQPSGTAAHGDATVNRSLKQSVGAPRSQLLEPRVKGGGLAIPSSIEGAQFQLSTAQRVQLREQIRHYAADHAHRP